MLWKRTAEQKNEYFLNELDERTANFTDEHFARFERIIKMRGRASAPAIAAPRAAVPAQHTNTGMLMRSTIHELSGRDDLGIFLKRF